MPQLDKYIFVPEVFWLVFLFLSLYFILLRSGIPKIFKVLRYRAKFLNVHDVSLSYLEKELFLVSKKKIDTDVMFIKGYNRVPFRLARVFDQSSNFFYKRELAIVKKSNNILFSLESEFVPVESLYRVRLIKVGRFIANRNALLLKAYKA